VAILKMTRFLTNKETEKILAWLETLPDPIPPPYIPPGPPKPCRPKLPGHSVLEDIDFSLSYVDNMSRWHLLHLRANILEKMRWEEAEREMANIRRNELTACKESKQPEGLNMAAQYTPTLNPLHPLVKYKLPGTRMLWPEHGNLPRIPHSL